MNKYIHNNISPRKESINSVKKSIIEEIGIDEDLLNNKNISIGGSLNRRLIKMNEIKLKKDN